MNAITNDKHIKFVLENYDDISAIDELLTHAKSKLPDILQKLVHKCIDELEEELNELGMKVDSDMNWYNPSLYDEARGIGLYFGFAGDSNYLFDGEDPDGAPFLYLKVETYGIKTKKAKKKCIDEHFAKISDKKLRLQLKKKEIVVEEMHYDDPELLTYPLYREINLRTVIEKEKLIKKVKRAILTFTKIAAEAIH